MPPLIRPEDDRARSEMLTAEEKDAESIIHDHESELHVIADQLISEYRRLYIVGGDTTFLKASVEVNDWLKLTSHITRHAIVMHVTKLINTKIQDETVRIAVSLANINTCPVMTLSSSPAKRGVAES